MRKFLQSVLLIVISVTWFIAGYGCATPIQPIQPAPGVQAIMLVPSGTKIGSIVTDANGIYINENFPGELYLLPPGSTIKPEKKEYF